MTPFLITLAIIAALVALPTVCRVGRFLGMRATINAGSEGTAGTHKIATKLSDAAHNYSHLLVKAGSDADHVAVCGAANMPIGLTTDQPSAAEQPVNVNPLGLGDHTRKVRVASALAKGIDLYTAANGFAQAEPAVAGSYWKVGTSFEAAQQIGSGDYLIEFVPTLPIPTVVVAAFTSTNGTAAAASGSLANLAAEAEKIGDDVRSLGAALATPAMVKGLAA
jgi:hypothetical protein